MSDERIRVLTAQLEQARRESDAERAQKEADTVAARERSRQAAQDRHDEMMAQMKSLGSAIREQKDDQAKHAEQLQQALGNKSRRKIDTDTKLSALQGAVMSVRDGQKSAIGKACHEGKQDVGMAGMETLLQEVRKSSAEKTELLISLSDQIQEDSKRRHEELRSILLANASALESMSFSDEA